MPHSQDEWIPIERARYSEAVLGSDPMAGWRVSVTWIRLNKGGEGHGR